MKAMKKVFAIVCALAMVLSMVTIAQAASIDNPLSLVLTDNGDNTVTVDIKTADASFKTACAYIKVPVALKDYITGWEITAYPSEGSPTVTAPAYPGYVKGSVSEEEKYIQVGINWDATNLLKPVDGKIASVKLTLAEGGVPESVDRKLTLGCEYNGTQSTKRKGCSYYGPADTGSMFYFVNTVDATETPKTPSNSVAYDPTVAGNYVVIPEAKAEEPDNTVAFEGFTGTKEDGETPDGSVAVATSTTFTTKADAPSQINWTVTLKNGAGVGRYTSTVDTTGGAEFTLGMVINGLAAELVETIEAVLAQ